MDALTATYGSDSDDDKPEPEPSPPPIKAINNLPQISSPKKPDPLPPPPADLLNPPNSRDLCAIERGVRIRSFPHVKGNFALHVFIPVHIPSTARKLLASYVKKVASAVSGLYVVDVDFALNELCKDDQKLDQMLLGREFHISLSRTVPIQVHQIDSIVATLQQKFQSQRRYQIAFNKWDVFVNDDQTRSFISLEVTGEGLAEINKQIRVVDEIYRLHGLPEFYKNPRPHISLVWAPGDISVGLKKVVAELDRFPNRPGASQNRFPNRPGTSPKNLFSCRFSGVECRIGQKLYSICKLRDQ